MSVGVLLGLFAASAAAPEISSALYGEHGRTVSASCYVQASPQAVFRVLTDYAHMHEFMPMVVKVDLLSDSPGKALVKFRFRYLHFFDFEEIDERELNPPFRITFRSVQGPLKSASGVWRMMPEGRGTRLSYRISAEPAFAIPGPVTEHIVTQGALELIEGLRKRAESGSTWKRP